MAGIKFDRKEIQDRVKKVFKKLFPDKKEKLVPQLVLQPYRNRQRP
jgi:hypothetical protein